jgi:hypothetical protein
VHSAVSVGDVKPRGNCDQSKASDTPDCMSTVDYQRIDSSRNVFGTK